jgi:hypothetical protein
MCYGSHHVGQGYWFNRRSFSEDNAICARISPAFGADPARGVYAASEAKVVHLRAYLASPDTS